MAEYVPVPGTVLVEMRMALDAERIENTLYFNKAGAWIHEDMLNMGGAMVDWWTTGIAPQMSVSLTLVEVHVTDLTTAISGVASVSPATAIPGAIGLESSPNNVCICISLQTANRGRSFQGRNYLSGLPENAVNFNRVTSGVASILQDAYNDLRDVATTQGCDHVVVSRYSGVELVAGKKKPIPRAEGISTPVTNCLFKDLIVDSQRGRLPGH